MKSIKPTSLIFCLVLLGAMVSNPMIAQVQETSNPESQPQLKLSEEKGGKTNQVAKATTEKEILELSITRLELSLKKLDQKLDKGRVKLAEDVAYGNLSSKEIADRKKSLKVAEDQQSKLEKKLKEDKARLKKMEEAN